LHAAIALENARLLNETNAALEELSVASSLLREHTSGVERASSAHDRLTRLVLRGGDVKDVAAAVSEVLRGTLWVFDVAARPIASTAGPSDVLTVDLAAMTEAAQMSDHPVRRDDWWAVCVTAGHEPLGTLLLHSENALSEWDVRTFERAALVTALLLLLRRSVAETESRIKGELLDDILDGSLRDLDSLKERARRVSADLDARQTVVVARSASGDRGRLVAAASFLAGQLRGLATEWHGAAVLLVPADDPGVVARQVCAELARALGAPVTAGASALLERPEQVPKAWREARRCLEALEALGRGGEGASAAELGFLGVLLGDRLDVIPFVRRTIGPVLDYDEEHGTDLVGTLEAYFRADRNLVRSHEALQIHVHTVTQRLERVAKLLDDGWQQHDRCLEVHIALRLHRISRPVA
jgi:sugar diacid utilization regulator